MQKSLLFLGCFLAIDLALTTVNNGSASAQIIAPGSSVTPSGMPSGLRKPTTPVKTTPKSPAMVLSTFDCQTRGIVTTVALKSDRTYKTGTDSKPTSGSYQKIGDTYRFKDGTLKNRSIVQLRNNYYLVATDKEARAAAIAATDAAEVCTKKR
jgi:hypothetical protein